MPAIEITPAPQVEAIANDLISEIHEHLSPARILYLFTNKKRKRCDRVVLGSTQKLSGMQRFLSSGNSAVEDGYDFIILIGKAEWEVLEENQRRALVDHELCHCGVKDPDDEEPEWMLKGHDVEEFRDVIARHGFWKDDIKDFAKTVQQMRLPTPLLQGGEYDS